MRRLDDSIKYLRTWLATKLEPDKELSPPGPPVALFPPPPPTPDGLVKPPTTPVALRPRDVAGARLFADREQMMASLDVPEGGVIAEVGVATGDFSEVMLKYLRPKKFVAFDVFTMHEFPIFWGIPSEVLFDGLTHLEFYKRRFSDRPEVVLEAGLSLDGLARYDDNTFDLVYIDAGHDYESVRRDAELSRDKLKDGGILVFNDYTMYDHLIGTPYGIVQVVNEVVVNDGWHVVGFALQRDMFCDIAIQADCRTAEDGA